MSQKPHSMTIRTYCSIYTEYLPHKTDHLLELNNHNTWTINNYMKMFPSSRTLTSATFIPFHLYVIEPRKGEISTFLTPFLHIK